MKPAYFWWVFRQWWMVLVPVSLALVGVASTIIMLTYKPDFRASALVMIEESPPYVVFDGEGATSGSSRYVDTQIELLRSPLVLEVLLADPEIANYWEVVQSVDRLAHLQENLYISRIKESELFNVSYVSKSPEHAARVVNSVVDEYLKIQEASEVDRFRRVAKLLDDERGLRSAVVEQLKNRVLELSKDVTGRDPFGLGSTLDVEISTNNFASTKAELTRVEVELYVLSAQLRSLEEGGSGTAEKSIRSGRIDLLVDMDSQVLAHDQAIQALEDQAEEIKKAFNEGADPMADPTYARILKELETSREARKKYKTQLREAIVTQLRDEDQAASDEAIADFESEIGALKARKELLTKKFEDEVREIQAGNSKSIELTFAQAELERQEAVFEMIEDRKLAMQTESRAPPRVNVRQGASVPALPISKVPYKMLLMACAVCVAAPFGLAVLREMSICRISDVEQLSRESSVRVVGEVSHFPIRRAAANSQALPPKLRRQMFVYLESIDSLRTNLWLGEAKSANRVLVVTSAAAAEGKTCLATSLAVSIGNAEKKPVLVIDGDMRSPDVATVLNTRDRPGLRRTPVESS